MDEPKAIIVKNISKNFLLPHEKVGSIKGAFTGLAKRRSRRTKETQHALRNINFEVSEGEFFGIVGRNGSGKSTLLKIIAGIYQPTEGKVVVNGRLVPFIELGVGFNPELSGRDNVYLNGAMLGFSHKEINSMYNDIVAFAEIEKFMDQKLKNYSSGMQVRLAFSMATRAKADILLVDEVLAVGDADFQRKCFEYFRQLKKNKKTVVFVTHDMAAVREYCDRAVLVDNSEIVTEGTADKVALAYTRMFNEEAAISQEAAKKSNRWGTKQASYSSAELAKSKIQLNDNELIIKSKIKAKEGVSRLEAGFIIKDGRGTQILGADNNIKGQIINMSKGEAVSIEWAVPNIFRDGSYTVDLVLQKDGAVFDWWEDALSFSALRDEMQHYVVAPPVKLTIHSNQKRNNE